MSVTSQIPRKVSTAAPGATLFPYDFKVLSKFDMEVQVDGVTKTVDVDYTLTGVGLDAGGDITFLTPMVGGESVLRRRAMSYERANDFQQLGDLRSQTLNNDQDAPVMMIQQLAEVLARCLQLPADSTSSAQLPAIQALRPLLGNAAGTGFEFGDTTLTGDMLLRPNLADTTTPGYGSELVGFRQDGVGATSDTVREVLLDRVSVMRFIPRAERAAIRAGTSTYDATAAVQAALDSLSAGGALHFPAGLYLISSALTVSNAGVTIVGSNYHRTIIRQSTTSAPIFTSTAARFAIRDVRLDYSGTPVAGAIAINLSSTDARINCVLIGSCYTGVFTTGGSGLMMDSLQVQNYVYAGVHCQAVNDVYCSKFIFNAGNSSNGAGGGIRLENKVEAAVFTDGDILNGVFSMVTTSASNSIGARPAYNNFTNVYYDSAVSGVSLTNLVETEFVGCWFSGGRSGGGAPGCTVNVTDSVNFIACRFFNCGGHGCQVNVGAVRTTFVACSWESNSVTAGAGVCHGLTFAASASDFSVIGGKARNGLFSGQQGYGIFINSSCDRFCIRDVHVGGNATAGIQDGSSNGANKTISGCKGYVTQAKGTSSVAVGQTVATVTHGLGATPGLDDILVMPTQLMSQSSISSWRIVNATSTDFQVQTNTAVVTNAFTFAWKVRIKGD